MTHSTLHTTHCLLHTAHYYTLHTNAHCTLHNAHCTLHCTLYTAYWHNSHCTLHTSLDKYFQIVGWWLGQHGKCCVYAKRMFSQNFRVFEKKLARRHAYLVNSKAINYEKL